MSKSNCLFWSKGNDSLVDYSTKLKKLYDALNCLEPKPRCTCGKCTCEAYKRTNDIYSSNLVMRFLMGLNDSYDNMIGNVLMMEPLPSFNKVYSMFSRVENQRSFSSSTTKVIESSALAAKFSDNKLNTYSVQKGGAKNFDKKQDRFRDFCNKTGDVEEASFKKNGCPKWFKDYKAAQKGKKSQNYANNVDAETVMRMKVCRNKKKILTLVPYLI